MHKVLIAAAFIGSIGTAYAGDGYGPQPRPFIWTGAYVGGNVGYSWGRTDTDVTETLNVRRRIFVGGMLVSEQQLPESSFATGGGADADGAIGGGHIGFNWQSGRWVYGFEADIQASDENSNQFFCSGDCTDGEAFAKASLDLHWFGTVRARAGVLLQPTLLIYGTGGLAYGRIETNYAAGLVGSPLEPLSSSNSSVEMGWVIGGGLEGALGRNWLLRLEYLYMDFGRVDRWTESRSFTQIVPGQVTNVFDGTATAKLRTDFTDQVLRVGLSYKFD